MRPDKRKKNRGRNSEKSEGNAAKDVKADENIDNRCEGEPSTQKETEKADSTPVKVEETVENTKTAVPPIPNLRRETDDLKETKKFSKRQIFSNWDKYDEPIVPEEEDEIHDDFGSLIQRNFSGDEHFKFKFQQQWEKGSCNINQDLFTLNLERLSTGLNCIPYYKRLNLPVELFSEDELQKMQDDAKAKVKDYESILKGEPVEPVTASLLGKLKECIEVEAVNEPKNDEMTSQGIEEFSFEGYSNPEESLWDLPVDQNPKEVSLVRDTDTSAQMTADKIIKNESNTDIKEEMNSKPETDVKTIEEKVNVLSFDLPERVEVEKEQRQKRSSNRRREAANRSSNKIEQSNNLAVNTTEVKPTIKENIAPKEEILRKEVPEKLPEVKSPQEIDNVMTTKEPKVEIPPSDKKAASTSLPIKKPVTSASTKKNRFEEDDELDSLLSLKEPSLPQFSVNHKAQDDESEMEGLSTNVSSIVIHEKKENLEEWLDSMLDD